MTGPGALQPTALDLYEVAHLAGGPPRVTDTAVVVLLERGLLSVDGGGRLHVARPVVGHPVERAVLHAVGPRPGHLAASLHWRLAEDPSIAAGADRLTSEGLLRSNPVARRRAAWPRRLRTRAGRRLLEQWRTAPPAGIGSSGAVRVALRGPEAMTDRVLRDSVFGADEERSAPRRGGNRPWHVGSRAHAAQYQGPGTTRSASGGDVVWGGDGSS